jgi:hypothetical protein
MNLHNKSGNEFRLQIVGYQFPNIVDRYWDSNWLNVRVSSANSASSWSLEDSCFLTFEIESLATWLEKLVLDKTSTPHISFTEPSPQFRIIKHQTGKYLLRVDLGYIFRKKMPDIFRERKTIHLYFPLDQIDLLNQSHLLREQLKKYPQRVFR